MDKTVEAMKRLKAMRKYMSRAQCQTIRGKILSGDIEGAMNGMTKIKRRWCDAPKAKRELNTRWT